MGTLGAQDNSRALVPLSIKTHRPTMFCFVLRNMDFSNGKKIWAKRFAKNIFRLSFEKSSHTLNEHWERLQKVFFFIN